MNDPVSPRALRASRGFLVLHGPRILAQKRQLDRVVERLPDAELPWEGKLEANNAILAGEVEGTVLIREKLEIRKTARIKGTVQARVIAVAEGAVIDGEMAVTSGMARPSAWGQAITSTVTTRSIVKLHGRPRSGQTMAVRAAETMAMIVR